MTRRHDDEADRAAREGGTADRAAEGKTGDATAPKPAEKPGLLGEPSDYPIPFGEGEGEEK